MISKNEFQSLCGKHLIDVGIALENPNIQGLLFFTKVTKKNKDEILWELEQTLKEEF